MRGPPLGWSWASRTASSVTSENSTPLGKNRPSSPLAFSFAPGELVYAETEEDPNDRRASVVRLTNAGRTWAHDMVRRITRAEDGAMAALAPEEQEALVSLSRRFTEHLLALIDDPNLKLEEDA